MKIIDPGHRYKLNTLDGDEDVTLTFVKREGEKYPGNIGHHPGTTAQEVIRALLDRMRYVHNQIPASENREVITNLKLSLIALERRAARLHDRPITSVTWNNVEFGPLCPRCGHVGHICGAKGE